MIWITRQIAIDEKELTIDFVQSSGPGGQNVNKVATAACLRFDIGASSLPEAVKARLLANRDRRVTTAGVLVIDARRFRTAERNRADAIERLAELVRLATVVPKKRRATRPSKASVQRRLDGKSRRGAVKKYRRGKPDSRDE